VKFLTVVLPLALVVACQPGPSLGPTPLRVSVGDFHFIEHPQGIQTPFEGTISVIADEISVDTKEVGCFTVVTNDPRTQTFQCGDYAISARKIGEGWEFFYGTQREVEQRYSVCDSYKTTTDGARVCASTHDEVRYRKIPVNGRIHLVPVTMAGITPPQ
jgi:hypothetical protein